MDGIKRSLKRLHDDGDESDVTLEARGQQWKLHKLVLQLHCPAFYKLTAKKSNVIELNDTEPVHATALVKFLYHLDYDPPEDRYHLKFHVAMNVLGSRLAILDLQSLALKKAEQDPDVWVYELKEILPIAYGRFPATYEMKRFLARVYLKNRLYGFDSHVAFAHDIIEEAVKQKEELEKESAKQKQELQKAHPKALGHLKRYKHCKVFLADFSGDPSNQDVWFDSDDEDLRRTFSCVYCGRGFPRAFWETCCLVKEGEVPEQ